MDGLFFSKAVGFLWCFQDLFHRLSLSIYISLAFYMLLQSVPEPIEYVMCVPSMYGSKFTNLCQNQL